MPLSDQNLRRLSAHLDAGGEPGAFVPVKGTRRRNPESECQRALIRWWRTACREFGVPEILLFSIPNGGGGGEKRGVWLKLEGLRKGAPDLMLAVHQNRYKPVGGPEIKNIRLVDHSFHALFLELKTSAGRLSPEQEVYHEHLRTAGYSVVVARSLDECKRAITEYLRP